MISDQPTLVLRFAHHALSLGYDQIPGDALYDRCLRLGDATDVGSLLELTRA